MFFNGLLTSQNISLRLKGPQAQLLIKHILRNISQIYLLLHYLDFLVSNDRN